MLELPFPWCAASADYFANAAVSIARHFADTLIFGSECGDVGCLTDAAEVCEKEDFILEYSERTRSGEGSASVFADCLEKRGFPALSSNDLLGLAYIRAVKRMGATLTPITVKRRGASYNDTELSEGVFPSATALRELIMSGQTEKLPQYMPAVMTEIIVRELEAGRLTDMSEVDAAVLGFFRLTDAERLEGIAETQGGIVNLLGAAARESVSAEEMLERSRTKRYTDARIRRAMLYCLTGTEQSVLKTVPEYTVILGANSRGRALLAANRKNGGIPVVTKPADAPRDTAQHALSDKLDAFYALARKKRLAADAFYQKNPYIVK